MSSRGPVRNGVLWFALLGGPAAWTVHLLASYPLVPLACRMESTWPLHLITLATAATAAAAAAVGALAWRKLRRRDDRREDERQIRGRALFMAGAGAVLGLFFVYVIVVEGLPAVLQDPCTGVL